MKASVALVTALCLSACGSLASSTSGGGAAPSPDPKSAAYVALVKSVYRSYNAARGDAYDECVVTVDPPSCGQRGAAMAAVWHEFLKDLDATPAPARFADDDRTIRANLPKGIADLETMVAAAQRNDSAGVVHAANDYIGDMQPNVTDALGDVYAPWRTN